MFLKLKHPQKETQISSETTETNVKLLENTSSSEVITYEVTDIYNEVLKLV